MLIRYISTAWASTDRLDFAFCETLSATARLNKLLCKSDQNNIEWIKKSDGNAATQPQDILRYPLS